LAKFKFFDLNNKINHELEKERQVDKKKLIKKIKSKDFWVPNNHFSKFNDYERPIIINNSFHQPNTTSNEPRIDYSDDIHISIIDFKKESETNQDQINNNKLNQKNNVTPRKPY